MSQPSELGLTALVGLRIIELGVGVAAVLAEPVAIREDGSAQA